MDTLDFIDDRTEADKAFDSFYRISVHRMDDFMKKIDHLNRRAAKMGCSPIKVELLGQMTKVINNKTGEVEVYNCVTIEGQAPTYNGWTFISSIEHTSGGNIIRNATGHETPVNYRNADNYCDHCNSRRHRKETFIIRHEDGTYKQIGRNCLADFLNGHPNPESFGKWFDFLSKAQEEANNYSGGGSGGERCFDLERYMAFVVECIDRFGWVSRSRSIEQWELYDKHVEATFSRALRNMLPARTKQEENTKDFKIPSQSAFEKAKPIIAWGKSLKQRENLNDYLHNLSVIANNGYVTPSQLSFAASMAHAYQMELDNLEYKERQAKEKEERKKGVYVGEIGKRQDFTITVKKIISFGTKYGITYFHIMSDDKGNNIVWYSSNKKLEEGKTYNIKATVKDHKEYKGEKQTVLTRCAVV